MYIWQKHVQYNVIKKRVLKLPFPENKLFLNEIIDLMMKHNIIAYVRIGVYLSL